MDRNNAAFAARLLRWGVAFVWLWTGLAVFHPYYREQGSAYLAPLGLPPAVMYATCAAEVLLGLRVALGRAATWVTVLQLVLITGFTAILSVTQPALWLDPPGVLTKNLALVVMLGTAWLLEREGWTRRAERLLRFGLALFWVLDGAVVLAGGSRWVLPVWEIALSVATCFSARGVSLSLLWAVAALVLGTLTDTQAWFHPFGPLSKVVAIGVAGWVATDRFVPLRDLPPYLR